MQNRAALSARRSCGSAKVGLYSRRLLCHSVRIANPTGAAIVSQLCRRPSHWLQTSDGSSSLRLRSSPTLSTVSQRCSPLPATFESGKKAFTMKMEQVGSPFLKAVTNSAYVSRASRAACAISASEGGTPTMWPCDVRMRGFIELKLSRKKRWSSEKLVPRVIRADLAHWQGRRQRHINHLKLLGFFQKQIPSGITPQAQARACLR